eukprot:366390-Chlamydomonas_euryale.AAC.36
MAWGTCVAPCQRATGRMRPLLMSRPRRSSVRQACSLAAVRARGKQALCQQRTLDCFDLAEGDAHRCSNLSSHIFLVVKDGLDQAAASPPGSSALLNFVPACCMLRVCSGRS